MHDTVIGQIDKYRKHCLWRGSDTNAISPPKVYWEMFCLPKSEGGLGVIQLKTHNQALLLKNFHKFFNKAEIPWVQLVWEKYYSNGKLPSHITKGSFWWKDILKLLDKFKGLARVKIFRGDTCYLWHDLWSNSVPSQAFPELLSFARSVNITLEKACESLSLEHMFNLPLSETALAQLLHLAQLLQDTQLSDEDDVWTYIWGSPLFTSKNAYIHLIGHHYVHPGFKWLWAASTQKKYFDEKTDRCHPMIVSFVSIQILKQLNTYFYGAPLQCFAGIFFIWFCPQGILLKFWSVFDCSLTQTSSWISS
jgi:hypothetical protein